MFKHNLTITLNTQRPDKNGMFPIRLRTTIKRKIVYYSTGFNVKPANWNDKKKEVVGLPNRVMINAEIKKQMTELEAELIRASLLGEDLVKAKKKSVDFIKFCEAKIKDQSRDDKSVTTKHKQSDLNLFKRFKPALPFSDLNITVLHQFEDYCKVKLGNTVNTVWGHMKFIKAMMGEAVKDGYLDAGILKQYKMPKYEDPERDHLSLEEVDRIEAFRNVAPMDRLRNVADWFLFSCYTGFRYEDVRLFTKEKIHSGKILLRTSKKGTDVTLAIHPRLQAVIARMSPGVYSNQKCNDYLKIVAAGSSINKKLTMHVARHSFAVIFLELGGSMEALSKLLGHTKMSTTLIYGRITNKRLDDEVKKVWG